MREQVLGRRRPPSPISRGRLSVRVATGRTFPRLPAQKSLSLHNKMHQQQIKQLVQVGRVLVDIGSKCPKKTQNKSVICPVLGHFGKENIMFSLVGSTLQTVTMSMMVKARGYDPGVTPNMDSPWNNFFQDMGGRLIGTGFIVLAIFAAVFLFMWLGGRIGSNSRAQEGGLSNLLWVVLGAVLLASIGGAIAWFSGFSLF